MYIRQELTTVTCSDDKIGEYLAPPNNVSMRKVHVNMLFLENRHSISLETVCVTILLDKI